MNHYSQSNRFEHTAIIEPQSNFIKMKSFSTLYSSLQNLILSYISQHSLLKPVNYVLNSVNMQYSNYKLNFQVAKSIRVFVEEVQ